MAVVRRDAGLYGYERSLRRAGFVMKKELEGLDGVDQVIAAGLEELGLSQRVPPEAPELLEAYGRALLGLVTARPGERS